MSLGAYSRKRLHYASPLRGIAKSDHAPLLFGAVQPQGVGRMEYADVLEEPMRVSQLAATVGRDAGGNTTLCLALDGQAPCTAPAFQRSEK